MKSSITPKSITPRWLGCTKAAAYIGYSTSWVEVRAIAWHKDNKPIQGRLRYKINPENRDRKYVVEDLDNFFIIP